MFFHFGKRDWMAYLIIFHEYGKLCITICFYEKDYLTFELTIIIQ